MNFKIQVLPRFQCRWFDYTGWQDKAMVFATAEEARSTAASQIRSHFRIVPVHQPPTVRSAAEWAGIFREMARAEEEGCDRYGPVCRRAYEKLDFAEIASLLERTP